MDDGMMEESRQEDDGVLIKREVVDGSLGDRWGQHGQKKNGCFDFRVPSRRNC